ncbi:MAG TPA: 1,4-alpha-glucan branching protein domain-containing protein [Gemmatimonadales bacterium]|jgi:1,4-alpha-glucan branching enzyme|nr:1,4-alpha-glucan branching protein domain-containing protein [Gemmatimonadales bacterium]
MDFILTLHSHLPYVLNHGRWPHGSDWLCEAMTDTYLPLLEALETLEAQGVQAPLTIGVTPILASQLAHPALAGELAPFFAQRLAACDEAAASFAGGREEHLVPLTHYWRERFSRLERLYERCDGDVVGALRRHAAAGRIELLSSAATHGFLPLLSSSESINLQLATGRAEHRRLFGELPRGCWLPECAYRPGLEEHLAAHGYGFFFVDAHLAEAGQPLGLYRETGGPNGWPLIEEFTTALPQRRTAYRTYEVSPRGGRAPVVAFVRDPESTRQVWSRHGGFPGDGSYLEFHKIRWPGGLKLWRVTHPNADLGLKEPYEPNAARARAWAHAGHLHWLLRRRSESTRQAGESVIVAPFDTELFGHWWFEGVDFLADLYRFLAVQGAPLARTASQHLAANPPDAAIALATGSWGANGDFSMWQNPGTQWTWDRLWPLEQRFWAAAPGALADPALHAILAQAARELLLLQSSDWQFIISTGAAADYASRRFLGHAEDLEALLAGLEPGGRDRAIDVAEHAERLRRRDDVFPDILPVLADVLQGEAVPATR